MIEYDYEIIRDEGDQIKNFKPDKIPTKLNNLIYIEGPNSSGKSTLLHILALSLYGLKNKKTHPALYKKMNNLINAKHQKLKYKVKITSADNSLEIVSEKADLEKPEIIVREISNGKKSILSPELFERKYNLIYDIPDNPTERLNQLTHEIKDIQIGYGNRLGELREYLRSTITEISNSRDPKRLKNLKDLLNKLKKEDASLNKEIILFEKELELLEKATYCKYWNYYYELKHNTELSLNGLKSKIREDENKEKKINKDYRKYLKWTQNRLDEMQETFDKATLLLKNLIPKNEEHYIRMWEKISLNQAYEDLEFDDGLRDLIINFKSIITKQLDEDQESFKELKLYQDLIDVLEQYKSLNISISGSEISIAEFINDLNESMKRKDKLIKLRNNINESLELLDTLKQQADDTEKSYFPKLKELKKDVLSDNGYISEGESTERDIAKLEADLKKYEEKFQFYNGEFSKEDLDCNAVCKIGEGELEKYSVYTEPQILSEISKLKDEIITKNAQSKKYKFNIENLLNEIDVLEKKKPHEYENYLDELNKLLEATTILETKLKKNFNTYISEIIRKKIDDTKNLSGEQFKYYEALFSYLGERVGTIRHLDRDYEIDKIDLIKDIITTKEGRLIRLADMGTGQGQAAYLRGLLNTSDNRKIIALFDEVAMMDSKSLEPIYEKMRELYSKNNLLVGIVVQKADKINIINI